MNLFPQLCQKTKVYCSSATLNTELNLIETCRSISHNKSCGEESMLKELTSREESYLFAYLRGGVILIKA